MQFVFLFFVGRRLFVSHVPERFHQFAHAPLAVWVLPQTDGNERVVQIGIEFVHHGKTSQWQLEYFRIIEPHRCAPLLNRNHSLAQFWVVDCVWVLNYKARRLWDSARVHCMNVTPKTPKHNSSSFFSEFFRVHHRTCAEPFGLGSREKCQILVHLQVHLQVRNRNRVFFFLIVEIEKRFFFILTKKPLKISSSCNKEKAKK